MSNPSAKSRLTQVSRQLSAIASEAESLPPCLTIERDMELVRRLLHEVRRAQFNCDAISARAVTADCMQRHPPFAVGLGPKLPGAMYFLTTVGADYDNAPWSYPFGETTEHMRKRTL